MRNYILIIIIAFLSSCGDTKKQDEENIRKTWTGYCSAITNNDGNSAAEFLDSATVKYYGQILELIKTADSNTVSVLRNDQKFLVLAVRHVASAQQINSFDGKKLFAFGVKADMFSSASFTNNILKNIHINDNMAQADFFDTTTKAGLRLAFRKEHKKWKINFLWLYANMGTQLWDYLINQSGLEEDEFILRILEELNGRKPDLSIWHPKKS